MWKLKVGCGGDPYLQTTNNFVGRQVWVFDCEDSGNGEEKDQIDKARMHYHKNRFQVRPSSDLLMQMQIIKEKKNIDLSLPRIEINSVNEIREESVRRALRKAVRFTSALQGCDGHWPAEHSSPLFLTPYLVIALYLTGTMDSIISSEHKKEILRHIYNHQNRDGGWGFFIQGHSTMLSTAFNYITLRLLGEGEGCNASISNGRKWILDHGGLVMIPTWGKMFLAVIGLYEWSGCNPVPPELSLLPKFLPIHPAKWLCCYRDVCFTKAYLYGKKFVAPINDLMLSLRRELYNQPYESIAWNDTRHLCLKDDAFVPRPFLQNVIWDVLHYVFEPLSKLWPFSKLRLRALRNIMQHIHLEDENSRYINLSAIGKALHMIACWAEDPNSITIKYHLARIPDYFWLAEDGMKVQNSTGCQLWDAAFASQPIIASDLSDEFGIALRRANSFIKQSLIRENLPGGRFPAMHRYKCKGAWTFCTRDQGWQVSDCTAEALKALLLLGQLQPDVVGEKIENERLFEAVDFLLGLQSDNGGFAVWEPANSASWLEFFNASEMFKNAFLEHEYGFWGICYTYAARFALGALPAFGRNYHNSKAVPNGCDILLSKKLEDGGWGESYLSCTKMEYTDLEGKRSNVVQTAWAMMALLHARLDKVFERPLHKAALLIINSQMENGGFPQQDVTGASMGSCMLHYASYKNIFPMWALGEYRKLLFASNT